MFSVFSNRKAPARKRDRLLVQSLELSNYLNVSTGSQQMFFTVQLFFLLEQVVTYEENNIKSDAEPVAGPRKNLTNFVSQNRRSDSFIQTKEKFLGRSDKNPWLVESSWGGQSGRLSMQNAHRRYATNRVEECQTGNSKCIFTRHQTLVTEK